ncbi:MAG: EpsG family protein, partial [Candidatus Margulisbacteria bacterium]|nr:EpsG family protein [Candidatus Margulisiibacteriota bacterium]
MTIYLINIFLIMLSGALFLYGVPERRNKKLFCILASSQWVLLSGLRHISIGPDTYSYKIHSFDVRMYQTWKELWRNFIDVLFRGAVGNDPGYYLFEKFVQIFTTNYQVYLIIIALIFTVPLGIWIYRNSSEPVISFLIYSTVFYSITLTAIRQTIATTLVVFLGYEFIKKRRFLPFLLLTLITFTIHKSSIFFFPFYFLANKKITKKYLFCMLACIPIMFVWGNKLLLPFAKFMKYENYLVYYEGANAWT